jgi:hypothetical protein
MGGPVPADPAANQAEKTELTEGSIIGRIVAIITPFLAAAAAWITGYVARHTGVNLDQAEIVALMVAVVTAGLGVGWKWLDGLQKHEQRVSEGIAIAISSTLVVLL